MNSRAIVNTALLAALAAVSGSAFAHRPWLLPSTTLVEEAQYVTVDAAVTEQLFYIDHVALKIDGLVILGPDGQPRSPENVSNGKLRTAFDVNVAQPGTYRFTIANENAMASWKEGGEVKRWRGPVADVDKQVPKNAEDLKVMTTVMRMETFVSSQKPSALPGKPVGKGIEFEPVTNPTDLHAGEPARWRFLIDGKPAANLPFSLVPGGVRYRGTIGELRYTTDAKGEANFALPAAGQYWLSTAWPAATPPAAEGKGGPAARGPQEAPSGRRLTYSATFEVLPQ
ncbi:DUF4198 domain-containing protein [Zemynaea arenosa]|nr:DUF4198 domain-containing protein [Massilia arenosa]